MKIFTTILAIIIFLFSSTNDPRWRGIEPDGSIHWSDELLYCRLDDIEIVQNENGGNVLQGVQAPMEILFQAIDTESTLVMTVYNSPLGLFTVNRTSADDIEDVFWLTLGECAQ